MTTTSENNKRIAKNTMFLYIRMVFLILVQLYTLPVILKSLGVEDYGIYNVVGGIVTLFSFIGGSLASGAQRFIAFELGKNNPIKLKKTFDSILSIYIILAAIALLLLEIGGYWFLNFHMNIPENRMSASNWVFQLSILSFIINLISIPYNAAVIAHEKMSVFAYVSILECSLKLLAAITLEYILFDHLIAYASMICITAVSIQIIYQFYCHRNFEECKQYHFSYNIRSGKEMLVYSGWNMIGSIALLSRQQGLNIVINIFFGPLLNAAHSIGQQINGALTQFINNIYMATRPQMTKMYAANNITGMWNLAFQSSKLAFYLLMILSIPLLLELETILHLWLHKVPSYTVDITRLMILSILIETMANQIIGVFQAVNKIKRYQTFASSIILLNIPISYILLEFHPDQPLVPYFISLFLSICFVSSVIWNAKKILGMNLKKFIQSILSTIIIVYIIIISLVWFSTMSLTASFFRLILSCLLTIIYSTAIIWLIGLSRSEKAFVKEIILKKLSHKNKY